MTDDDYGVRAVWRGQPPTATPDDSPFANPVDAARKAVNTIVRDLQARGYNGPKTLKDYMEAQDALLAAVRAEEQAKCFSTLRDENHTLRARLAEAQREVEAGVDTARYLQYQHDVITKLDATPPEGPDQVKDTSA